MKSYPEEDQEVQLKQAFQVFDKDGNGSLSKEEMLEAMTSMGRKFTPGEMDAFMRAVDQDSNGVIDFDEFKDMMSC